MAKPSLAQRWIATNMLQSNGRICLDGPRTRRPYCACARDFADDLQAADRSEYHTLNRYDYIGFRCARTP